jgi:hypothetical protein
MPKTIPLYYTKLYKRGQNAIHNGNQFVVNHVTVRGEQLFVHLEGVRDPIAAEHVDVEVTVIDFNRNDGGPKAWIDRNESPSEPVPDEDPNVDLPDDWLA